MSRLLAATFLLVTLIAAGSSLADPELSEQPARPTAKAGRRAVQASSDEKRALGQAIYRRGMLASGAPVQAHREGGLLTAGTDAACANCHQRSGLGTKEGRSSIPPIAGRYLFHRPAANVEDVGVPYVEGLRPDRPAYTDETLARAIRDGVGADGKPLSYLMPHYALDDAEMGALIAYLRKLDRRRVPGVTNSVLHFATIITPDADPAERRGMLDVLEHYFAEKNALEPGIRPQPHTNLTGELAFRAFRHWQLHVWELSGPPESWEAQLHQHLEREPVYAVISGLAGKDWSPVQQFCEHEELPCLFPNVEAAPPADGSFYSLYFSRGVLLEADLIAKAILDAPKPVARVDQVYRAEGNGGEAAARALAAALESRGVRVRNHRVEAAAGKGVSDVVRAAAAEGGALVLWLHPPDIASLGDPPDAIDQVFMSGLMGGLEAAPLPASWRARTRMAYPLDPPDRRGVRLDYPLGWFHFRHIPIVAQRIQVDTFLACGLLSDALNHVVDAFVRDYLVEHVEHSLETRVITGYYPHLALARGQRFASKGGYLMHFAGPAGPQLMADSEWLVP